MHVYKETFDTDVRSTAGLVEKGVSSITFGSTSKRKVYLITGLIVVTVAVALTVGLAVGLTTSDESEEGSPSKITGTDVTPNPPKKTDTTSNPPKKTDTTLNPPRSSATAPTTTPRNSGTEPGRETCFGRDEESPKKCPWSNTPLILISLDGFRAQYLQRHLTPTIERLRQCGVHTPYMRSVYPTLTFPNHYSIVTGLYPESHGIVNNVFYDQHINDTFILGRPNTANPAWWGGEPVWNTAEKQNVTTATYFWVGSDMEIQGMHPQYYFKYNGSHSYEIRVDQALAWLDLPEDKRPGFITLYFDEPDHTGHGSGPNSEDENEMLKQMDGIIQRLMDGLVSRNIGHCVNIIIVADHGMTETSCEREVFMKCFFDVDKTWITDGTIATIDQRFHRMSGPNGTVVVKTEHALDPKEIEESLECETNHYRVFTKDSVPKRFHFANNDRIGDVIVDVQDGWLVYGKTPRNCLAGNHGYDNLDKNMQALFLAFGPGFKKNIKIEPFENIELYNTFCILLGITPAPNNGTFGSLSHILSQPPSLTENTDCVSDTGAIPTCACQQAVTDESTKTGIPCASADIRRNGSVYEADSHIVVYSPDFHMPLAAVMHLTSKVDDSNTLTPTCSSDNADGGRDKESTMYHKYTSPSDQIVLASLLPVAPTLEHCNQSFPLVPMYEGFASGVWDYLWRLVNSYVEGDKRPVQVTAGPLFDVDHDGLFDRASSKQRFVDDMREVPLPTHFYMSLMRCEDDSDSVPCSRDTELLSFILPHLQMVPNCLDFQTYLMDNVVRVRDIELLSGLQFLGFIPLEARAQLSVRLPTSLWNSSVPTEKDSDQTVRNDSTCVSDSQYRPVLLVSLDGFRADYLSYNVTPNIQRLISEGVHATRLLSAYPSLTFPNHYTIATGLYPESHGIVDNKMFDINFRRAYHFARSEAGNPEWYGGDPIWLTVKNHGKKSACYFWVGSDVPIHGQYPDYYMKYDTSADFPGRVKKVLEWMSLPAGERPDFITLYFNEPDSTGHKYGPDPGEQMLETLRMVDGIIGDLMTGLQNRNLYDSTNLILVSDHGMSSRSCDRVVKLSDYFSTEEIYQMFVYTSASGRISNKYTYSKGNYTVLDTPHISTEEILGKLEGRSSQMAIYRKSQLPKRLHYANNIRIDDIVVKMNDQWVFSRFQAGGSGCSGGTHGWDAQYPSMGGLFVAHGPAFQEGLEVEPFENIEIYSLLTDLLNITGSSNNGTRGSLHHILKNPPVLEREEQTAPSHQAVSISVSQFQAHCNCSLPQEQKRSLLFSPQPSTILQPVTPADLSAVILAYDDHVSAYSPRLHMPAWTSFTVLREDDILQDGESCTVPDSNLPDSEGSLHSRYTNASLGVVSAPLFSTANSECGNITFSSAAVPMQDNLRNDLWVSVWQYVRQAYANTTRPVAVTVGPIFDYNSDGLADSISNISRFVDADSSIPLPSHYFLVLARCRSDVEDFSCGDNLDVLSFILPNDQPINGHSQGRRLHENVARVRDVELLTGLNFFLSADPARNAWLRTRVPLSLWTAAGFISDLTSTSVSYTTTPKPTPPATTEPIPTKPGSWKDQACPGEQSAQCNSSYKPVLLISLDGFRADYLVKYNKTPAIERLTQCGVHAPYMRSVYPTKTFPNHYTIVTGLYPESHGIIDNNMYDFTINRKFSMSSSESNNPDWWGGEPIWRTVQKQGKKSATYFWPGSGVKIQGRYPDIYRPYSDDDPFPKRVNTVLQWLRLPADQRPDFLTLYFNEPDHTGHVVGPDSPQIGEKLAEVDSMIDRLMMGLYYLDMQHCVNIIIIADHGMSGLSCDRQIVLSADISPEDMDNVYVYEGPVGRISTKYRYGRNNNVPINPPVVDTRTLEERLECSSPHMRVYTKNMLPLRHHYTNNDRIDDILLDADDGWTISRKGSSEQYCSGGNHGYDNLYASMHALFVAHGPAFKSGVMVDPFENIELYNLFADLVGVTPAPNNGTVGSLYHLLVAPPNTTSAVPSASPSCSKSTLSTAESVQQNVCQCSTTAVKAGSEWTSLLGDPVPNSEGPALCRTVKWTDHAVGYDKHMKAPAWVAFAVKDVMNVSSAGPETLCVARDPWLANNSLILDSSLLDGTEYQPVNLLLGADEPCNAAMASEVVPMLSEFKNGVWKDLQHLLVDYNSRYGDLSVTVGPVYDYSSTSKWQGLTNNTRLIQNTFPIPTHFFIMIGRCANQTSSLPCWDSLDLLSFLIPHRRSPSNCQNLRQLLRQNVARVRDVEIATGLRFFSDLPIDQAARLRTYLPTQLWEDALVTIPPPKPGHWLNQSCPQPDHADNQCPSDYRPVLLVSLDGFKPQYLNRGFSPVIDRLVACGVHSPAMRSVYPTKTFPNHYTIVTGLYPESHGIVDNTMYDPDIGERFSISSDNKSDPRWWGGEPIWITAHKQNVTSASFFWVGSDIQIDGSTPDLFKYYAGGVPFSIRVETVVQWMKLPADKRPDLMLLYFDEPDHQAHTSGPFTPEVDAQVQRVDTIMGQLMDSLYQNDLLHCVNLILVSDHGFAPMSCDQVVELRDYFNQTEEDSSLYYYLGPFGRIANTYRRNKDYSFTNFGNNPPFSVEDILQRLNCTDHMTVYSKTDLPKRHHYVNNDRIDNIILDMDLNWTVTDELTSYSRRYCTGGSHGWDNTFRAMSALFVGYGPAFKNGHTADTFENIELYNMMSSLLGIEPAPNNGTEGSLDHLLWKTFNHSRQPVSQYSINNKPVSSSAPCNCSQASESTLDSAVQVLSSQNITSIKQSALPFGEPLLMTEATGMKLLYQPRHVTAFSDDLKLPLWVSATVDKSMLTNTPVDFNCPVSDPRLSNGSQCRTLLQSIGDDITFTSLLPPGFDFGDTAVFLSSMIPMKDNFKREVWGSLQDFIVEWAKNYQDLNIISGPAFDTNSDGLADTTAEISRSNASVPTHVFLTVSRCNDTSVPVSRCSKIQTLSFILPQEDSSHKYNCQSVEEYLVDNEARVRDVELITGLQFFPGLPFTQAVAMRTYLPSGLWS